MATLKSYSLCSPRPNYGDNYKRNAKWRSPRAAVMPNFHLPMRSLESKNRTSTESIKSLKLVTAIKTPYLPDGRFDLEAYDDLVNIQIFNGVEGVIVGGTTGEGQLMSWDEHIMLIGHTVNCFGGSIKVIGNTGSNSTREAIHATEQGFAVGMHAALHINPYYGKTSLEGMVSHFESVLSMGPTIIYNVPSRTGQDIPPGVIHTVAQSANFAGVKECTGNDRVEQYTENGIVVWTGISHFSHPKLLRSSKQLIQIHHIMGFKGFVEGGIASIVAGVSTHPLDLIKVRMQLQGEPHLPTPALRPALAGNSAGLYNMSLHVAAPPRVGPISIGAKIVQTEGLAALFSGVSATVLRQTLYSTTRMGLYEILKRKWSDNSGSDSGNNLPLNLKISAGLIAGGVGAAVGNPADVAMVRMQADGRLPKDQRRNYKSVIDAISRMSKQEGIASLWRGSGLTVNRAMIVTASQLASYDQVKEMILERGLLSDGIGTHVAASFAAGFVAAVASNPIDVIKTRVMSMKMEAAGAAPPYSGALDCAMKTVRAEGPMALYKGFIPTISRQGPFTVVLFVTLEQVRKLFKDF